MHILLIHQAFASKDEPGGTRHFEFAKNCVARGHHFTVIASNVNYLTGKKVRFKSEENECGVKIIRASTPAVLHRSFAWRVLSFIWFMANSIFAALREGRIDIVIGTSPNIFQALSAWIVSILKRSIFVLEIRDLWPAFAIDMGVLKNSTLIYLAEKLEIFLYNRARIIIANSPAFIEYIAHKGIAKEKLVLISNGTDTAMFTPDVSGNEIRKKLSLDEDTFLITYAGALGQANDIDLILDAASKLKKDQFNNLHLLLVGDGKEKGRLESKAKELDLANVTFHGPQAKSEMPKFFAASNAFVATLQNIPMFSMTYPNKVFDYMASARPVVLAIDGVIRQVVEAAQCGIFVPPGDSQKLCEAFKFLADNPDVAQRMGENGRRYVVHNFDRNSQANQFLETLIGIS